MERSHQATRLFGQYEVKARVLEHLVSAVDYGVHLTGDILSEIYKEISICRMHAGHLPTAGHFAARALAALRTPDDHTPRGDELFRLVAELESVVATVDIRNGRAAPQVRAHMAHLVEAANDKLKDYVPDLDEERRWALPGPAGAARILAREADILLQSGDVEAAITAFTRTDWVQREVYKRPLNGEAARKFVVALTRARGVSALRLESAKELISANIEYIERDMAERGGASADLAPFLIQGVSMQRASGNLDLARTMFSQLKDEEVVRRSTYTFQCGVDMEMEAIRLRLAEIYQSAAAPWEANDIREAAHALARRLEQSHHWMASWEAKLLYAETFAPAERLAIVKPVRDKLILNGWRLRLADVDELVAGRSAVLKYHL